MQRQQVITAPTDFPVTRDYVKLSLKLTSGDVENGLLDVFIGAATEEAESRTGLRMMATELADYHEDWCTRFVFWNAGNVLAIDAIEYMAEGAETYTTLAPANYVADLHASPAAVKITGDMPAINTDHPEAIKITYTAGYSAGDVAAQQAAVPKRLKQGIAILAAHWYMYRTDYAKKELPAASTVLFNQLRVAWI